MFFYSYFNSDTFNSIEVEENIISVQIIAKTTQLSLTQLYELHNTLKLIHKRDKFELFLDIDGSTSKNLSDNDHINFNTLIDFYKKIYDEAEQQNIKVSIKIKKNNANHCISVYFLDSFVKYINQTSLNNIIETIQTIHNGHLCFEVNQEIIACGSDTIQFIKIGLEEENENIVTVFDESNRADKLKLISEHVNTDLKVSLLPSDFDLSSPSDIPMLSDFFNRACTLLSLMYIANISEIHSDGTVSFKINGFKSICCDHFIIDKLSMHSKLLNKIVLWGYEGGACSDKIEMIRNVLSIHTKASGEIELSGAVWEAISSNYKIYLQKDIQSYLEVKNKITEMMIESTSKTHVLVDDILSTVKNSIFIIITFLLTVVLVNGLKDNGLELIFSNQYLAVVVIITIVSFIWLFGNSAISKKSYDEQSNTIISIIEVNYKNVLMDTEISECVAPIITKNKHYLKTQIDRYLKLGSLLLAIFLICYVVGNIIYGENKEANILDVKKTSPVLTTVDKKNITNLKDKKPVIENETKERSANNTQVNSANVEKK